MKCERGCEEKSLQEDGSLASTGLSSSADRGERRGRLCWPATCLCDLRTPLLHPSDTTVDLRCLNHTVFTPRRYAHLKRKETDKDFGVKTIGQIGSFVYLVNQIFGTGVIAIPNVFIASGWVPSLLADAFVCVAALLGTLMMLRCMTLVKGNRNFERRLEYMSVIKCYLAEPLYRVIQGCFYLSILASNLISIIVVAQAVDHLIAGCFGFSLSLSLYPRLGIEAMDTAAVVASESAVGGPMNLGVSLGYLLTAAACVPLAHQTMEENMTIQYVSFSFLVATIFGLSLTSVIETPPLPVPPSPLHRQLSVVALPRAFGRNHYGELLSTFLASYSYVNVVPSWANEMTWNVDCGKAIVTASIFAFLVYYLFGLIMASAYPTVTTDNILQAVLEMHSTNRVGNAGLEEALVYGFDLITVAPGILVYCITTRYNLLNSKSCGRKQAFFWASIFPFLIAWLLSDKSKFSSVLSWSALVFSLTVNFVAPCLIFLVACCISKPSIRNPVVSETRNGLQIWLQTIGGWISSRCAAGSALQTFCATSDSIEETADTEYEFQEIHKFRPGEPVSTALTESLESFYQRPLPVLEEPSPALSRTTDNCFVPWQKSLLVVPLDLWPAHSSPASSLVGRRELQPETPSCDVLPVISARGGKRQHVGVKRPQPPHDLNTLPSKLSRHFIWDTVGSRRRAVLLSKPRLEPPMPQGRMRRRAASTVSRVGGGRFAMCSSTTRYKASLTAANLSWGHALRERGPVRERATSRLGESCFIVVNRPDSSSSGKMTETRYEPHPGAMDLKRLGTPFITNSSETSDSAVDLLASLKHDSASGSDDADIPSRSDKLMLPALPLTDSWAVTSESLDGSNLNESIYRPALDTSIFGPRNAFSARHSLEQCHDRILTLDLSPCRSGSARRARKPYRSASLHRSRFASATHRVRAPTINLPRCYDLVEDPQQEELEAIVNCSNALSADKPIKGAEDAYEQDEDFFGDVDEIRIRVFPAGWMRANHIEITVVLLAMLVFFCLFSASTKLYSDVFPLL